MSSAKTERLVNLTMALLASRRYMQKSEIFRKVAGYTGSQETKERMFERDKDDLRAMGIQIDVASQDPLFEDEPGYRIRPETYQLPISEFSPEELGVISAALGIWRRSDFAVEVEGAVRRVKSSSMIDVEVPDLDAASLDLIEEGLLDISRALASRSSITFNYQKSGSSSSEERQVNPLGLSTWKGSWYLVGEDLVKADIRVFKLSRITSQVSVSKKRDTYEIPQDFVVKDYLVMFTQEAISITAKVKKDCVQHIRARATSLNSVDDEWDRISYDSYSLDEAVREALWFSELLVIESPIEAKLAVISSLEKVIANHDR